MQALSPADLLKYEIRDANYTLGWSRGKEKLENGQPDTHKGSYYAVPIKDNVVYDTFKIDKMPQFCR